MLRSGMGIQCTKSGLPLYPIHWTIFIYFIHSIEQKKDKIMNKEILEKVMFDNQKEVHKYGDMPILSKKTFIRKIIFTALLSLLALNISAQIQRNFIGNTLGVSTYDQVRYDMYDKGYHALGDRRNDYIDYTDVKFAGYTCEDAYFYFYDKKFYKVSFIIEKAVNTKEIFESLKDKLQNKYPNYKDEDKEDVVMFQDNTTLLILLNNTSDEKAENYLSLTYIDLKLFQKRIVNEMNKNHSDEL